MNSSGEPTAEAAGFVATRWTVVLRARGESPAAQAALGELCQAYYAPVLAFIRSAGRDEDIARDLTQEFFARLLAGHALDRIDPERGRFRSFLLGAVKHFIADQYDRAHALKRGAGRPAVSLETGPDANTSAQLQIPCGPAPDTVFDREWAHTLVGRALDRLAAQFDAGGKTEQFEVLKPWLLGQVESLSQAEAARRLGWSEGAVKVAIHRLRKQFREQVKTEIAHTLQDPAQLQTELRYLVDVLAS